MFVSLFTRTELAAAFALVFADLATATQVADEWWEQFADDAVDESGRFVYELQEIPGVQQLGSTEPTIGAAPEVAVNTAAWSGWPDSKKRELLLRFADFHFGLVALVSAELFDRVRMATGMSLTAAERNRTQMSVIAKALRGDHALST